MRRLGLLISMVALMVGMLAVPALADHTVEHAALQEALRLAQDEVDRLEAEVTVLEQDLTDAEAALAQAIADRDDQLLVVQGLEDDLADTEAELASAVTERDRLQGIIDATGNPDGECFGNPTSARRLACEAAKAALVTQQALVVGLEGEVADAEAELVEARDQLVVLEGAVLDAEGDVAVARDALDGAREELDAAAEARDAAQAALDAHVEPVVDEHPGCKGVKNAQEQVAKSGNSRGRAAEALATVAAKFDCAA